MVYTSVTLPKFFSVNEHEHSSKGEGEGNGKPTLTRDSAVGCPRPSLDILALSRHSCGRGFLTIQCSSCGHNRLILAGSRDRTCPVCSKEMYSRFYRRYEDLISHTQNLKFLTLTSKPVLHQDPNIVRQLGRALNRFLHRRPYRWIWKGLLATVECKKTPYGWFYYHIHCIVSGGFVPQSQISQDWKECSGFPIVWVTRISRTPKRALRYVLKYVLKGFSFNNPSDRVDFKASMHGVRYIRSYGDFYNFNYWTGRHVYFPCPGCGAVKSWVILEYLSEEWYSEMVNRDYG